jgi:5'-phosphate synthase pdxT subunit
MKIGVLALQGDFREHIEVLRRLGVEACEVRLPRDLDGLDGLIIPGGESTTIGKLAERYGLVKPIRAMIAQKKPVWGTCAGMIILARDIGGLNQPLIGAMDITVQRNAFGRQVDSFETELTVPALASVTPPGQPLKPFTAVFIRAPAIRAVGPEVEVLATLDDGTIVAARQGNLLATAFHPELTDDLRFHQYFLTQVALPSTPRNGQNT